MATNMDGGNAVLRSLDSAHDGLLVLDGQGAILAANPAAVKLLGLSADAHVGVNIGSRVLRWNDVQYEPGWEDLKKAAAPSPPLPGAELLIATETTDNKVPVVAVSHSADDGYLVLVSKRSSVSTLRQEVRSSRDRFRALVDGIGDPVFAVGEDFRVISLNRAAADLSGSDIRAIVGSVCYESIFHRTSPCDDCPLKSVLADGGPSPTTSASTEGGQQRSFDRKLFYAADDDVGTAIEYLRDRSAEVNLRNQLSISEHHAKIGELAAFIAHDLRSPLHVISVATETIDEKVEDDTVLQLTSFVREEVKRLDRFARQLLDFSKAIPTTLSSCSLRDIVSEALVEIEPYRNEASINLVMGVKANTPPVLADSSHIRRALVNLLINAAHFAGYGGHVLIQTGHSEAWAWVRVEDSGPGVSEDVKRDIFKPFFTTRSDGSGLGLAIASRLVELSEGTLRLSTPKLLSGATFEISLDLDRAARASARS